MGTEEGAGQQRLEGAVWRPWPEQVWRMAAVAVVGERSGRKKTSGCPHWRLLGAGVQPAQVGVQEGSMTPRRRGCLGHSLRTSCSRAP